MELFCLSVEVIKMIVVCLVVMCLLLGVSAILILLSINITLKQEKEIREEEYRRRQRDIKIGCIRQSRGD